ncbi:hypothetical protein D3C71_153800 [compost metagenome]
MNRTNSIPDPAVHIGMKLAPFALSAWERKNILRTMISEHVRICAGMRREGYLAKTPGDTAVLTKHVKGMIRAVLNVIDNAHTVEVAGVHGGGHHLGLSPVNQCYVGGGSGWSGMDFYAQLLWRATVDGNEVVVLQPSGSVRHCFSDRAMRKKAINSETAAAA